MDVVGANDVRMADPVNVPPREGVKAQSGKTPPNSCDQRSRRAMSTFLRRAPAVAKKFAGRRIGIGAMARNPLKGGLIQLPRQGLRFVQVSRRFALVSALSCGFGETAPRHDILAEAF